jgi:hypothetical protein
MSNSVNKGVIAKLRSMISYENKNKRIVSMHNCMEAAGFSSGADGSD